MHPERLKFPRIAFCVLFCLVFCVGAQPARSEAGRTFLMPDAPTMERLLAGDWVLESGVSDENGAAASILIFMRTPVERIWATIISCADAELFVDGLEFCEVLEEDGDYAITHQVVDKGWLTPRMDFRFETRREPYSHMQFKLLEGNLKTMHGSWDFKTMPDGVLVRHVLVLAPLVPAPRWLVRRNLKKDLPNLMQCVRGLSGGSGAEPALAVDLKKCPGNRKADS